MPRYRFGRIAASVAAAYVIAAIALGVVALATGTIDFVWWPLVREEPLDGLTVSWWVLLLLGLVAAVRSWAWWQVLRGPVRGAPPVADRRVTLLRRVLYISVAYSVVVRVLPWWEWWLGIPGDLLSLVTVVLYFLVLRVARWLRLAVLAGGLLSLANGIVLTVSFGLGFPDELEGVLRLSDLTLLAWMVPILAAQAKDPRWSRTTVGIGALSLTLNLLQPSSLGVMWAAGEVPLALLVYSLLGTLSVFGTVWEARSAHDLGSPLPAPRPRPVRAPARRWPLPAMAVVLPLLPAAVNLMRGMPFWLGPRGEIERFIREDGSDPATVAWLAFDLIVGVGAPAVLVLVAILRRTRRLLRVTMSALTLTAAVGAGSVLTYAPGEWWGPPDRALRMYPDDLFVKNDELVLTGISPLWYCAALLASALLLLLLYAAAPAERLRHHVLVAGLASLVTLAFLPAADQSRGPVTTAQDCEPQMDSETGGYKDPDLTAEQKYVCGIRRNDRFRFAATTPDQVLLVHGRRLCGVHTRNDPAELARAGFQRESLTYQLADICPSAATTVQAEQTARDREIEEWLADAQRMCDATPRHRPLIKPVMAARIEEPQRTDYGVMEAYGLPEDDYDPAGMELLDKAQDNGLVAARPGHLMVLSHSDFDVCVTVETYARRPPVETKGWDHVVEVGYERAGDSIVLEDSLGGAELPDLALDGYRGPYRIRVHYDWFDWKGERDNGQRLLIMAFPGKGDKVVTYRKPARAR
ncbi:hypothetical protein [Nonomuraea sp. SYSU D8015]|uniref:hypothetical protein n=1 Tax=Nonomuraea sp. SYSU D8015 TaxID=2593644 RepID=UPI001660A643|nr:hypothetical protein [Nonomuraea sp. SYSU D8015]